LSATIRRAVRNSTCRHCTAGFRSRLCPLWVIRVEVGQTCRLFMSALPPKADIDSTYWGGRYS